MSPSHRSRMARPLCIMRMDIRNRISKHFRHIMYGLFCTRCDRLTCGMRKWLFLIAPAGAYLARRADVLTTPKLQNNRVTVTELDYEPVKPRPKSIRQS